MSYLRRQLITAALAANVVRPLPGRVAFLSMFPGWLTGELAPHLMALSAADTARELVRGEGEDHHRDRLGLAVGTVALLGLGYVIQQSRADADRVEEALRVGLGPHYRDELPPAPVVADRPLWRHLLNPFRRSDPEVRVERDIAYTDTGARGMLDIYRPRGRELTGAPVLLHVHGGAWRFGRKDQQGVPLMRYLARRGWVAVSINYRLAPKHPFPAHIIDVKKAIAWIRDNIAAYGGDPGYIAITGGSAGGHLSALAATTPNDAAYQPGFESADTTIQAAVPHYGVYDLAGQIDPYSERTRDTFVGPKVLLTSYADHPDPFHAGSPLERITADTPDMFVIHGTNDTFIPVSQARAFVKRLRLVSRQTVSYAELPQAQHGFDVFPSIRSHAVVEGIFRFLSWHHARWTAASTRGTG